MAIYNGTQKVKPSGIAKVYVGSTLVYQKSAPSPVPTDYRILQYVRSGGSRDCALNLGFYPTGNTVVEADFIYYGCQWGWARGYGAKKTSNDKYGFYINNNAPVGSQYYISPNYGSFDPGTGSGTLVSKNTRYLVKQENGNLYLDGVLQSGCSTSPQTFTCGVTFYLCGVNNNGSVDSGATDMAVYSFKVWEGSTPIRDLVPVQRKSDDVAGMYDIVNDVFYSSITSQQFTAGPVVSQNS